MNISDQPKLYNVVLWFIFAFAVRTTGLYVKGEILAGFFYLVYIISLAAAGVTALRYIVFHWMVAANMRRKTQAITPYSEMIARVTLMTPAQIEFLEKYVTSYMEIPEDGDPFTVINGIEIPDKWITNFLLASEGSFLPPIRRFKEGSRNRAYAKALTDFLVEKGAAVPATGNRPARMESWEIVAEALGWQ